MRQLYRKLFKPYLSEATQEEVQYYAYSLPRPLRTEKTITRILGPQHRRSRSKVQIDITYDCNLRCPHCNRSCRQAPSKEQMSVDQIQAFIQESVDKGIRWERIDILGGEPTLHPDMEEIFDRVLGYRKDHSPDTVVRIFTNGKGKKVKAALERVPREVVVENSDTRNVDTTKFEAFNIPPAEYFGFWNADYTNGCKIIDICGIGLTPAGYYVCAVAGGMDRILGYDVGRKAIPSPDDDMFDHLDRFCRLCGHFAWRRLKKDQIKGMSPVWKEAYEAYQKSQPTLSTYTR